MAIYNLGTLEQPQAEANPYLAGLMEFGMKQELQKQQIQGQKDIATGENANRLQVELAKIKMDRDTKTRNVITSAWQNWSDKPDNERKMFVETPEGKEFFKFAKGYTPELFDEAGAPIPFPKAEGKGYQPQTQEEALAFEKAKKDIEEQIKEGRPFTPEQLGEMTYTLSEARAKGVMNAEQAKEAMRQIYTLQKALLDKRTGGATNPVSGALASQGQPTPTPTKPRRFRLVQ